VLFDTQNGRTEMSVRMARPSCEPKHIGRVFKEKLAALEGRFDPTLGFDAAALYAMRVEPLQNRQTNLLDSVADTGGDGERVAQFLDRVTARLGEKAVACFAFEESHWPERAALHVPATATVQISAAPALSQPRPLMLLPRPESIRVIALMPDYPPRKFIWRRCHHIVERAEGPERISPEWWSGEEKIPTARDYYRVEDEKGGRFWLYREGPNDDQRWFLHGLFP
jgi:protein ImuB